MNRSLALAAALLPAFAAPALAAGSFTLDQSTAILAVRAYAGTGIADADIPCLPPMDDEVETCSVQGDVGSFGTERTGVGPGRIGIRGEATAYAEDGLWAAEMGLRWETWQQYALSSSGSDLVLSATGGHESSMVSLVYGPGAQQPGTRETTVHNLQTFVFTLDQATAYTFSGSAYGEYMPIQLSRWDAGSGQFVDEGGLPSTFSSVMAAGTWRIRNFHLLQNDFESDWAYGWEYTLTLHDTVTAVPEPGSVAMLALGLAVVGAWKRRLDTRA